MICVVSNRKMKILVVDDDPMARAIPSLLLRSFGHEVLEAADGELAWRLVEEKQVNFVVSDWIMPKLAGVDLCRRIRAKNVDPYVYVILCTSKDAKADLVEGMDAGADDFVVKPISAEELRVKVRAGERILSLQQGLAEKNQQLAGINHRLQSAHKILEDDLKAAAWIQEQLLPSPALSALGVQCKWRFRPSSYIAGDTFNFFPLDDTRVGFYLLDVSGHGVPAAMLSVTLSMVLTPDATGASPLKDFDLGTGVLKAVSPAAAIHNLNRRFQLKDDRYFTIVYGILDTKTLALSLAQAGHPSPVLIRPGEHPRILGTGGMPVGLWPDMEFDCIDIPVCPGDRFLLYSDGVTECMSPEGEPFGEQRLLENLFHASCVPLEKLLEGLDREMKAWAGDGNFSDDVSLLAIEVPDKANRAATQPPV
jgi:sigma-B regulation protein RsbU (phosphoserine phosphatase)